MTNNPSAAPKNEAQRKPVEAVSTAPKGEFDRELHAKSIACPCKSEGRFPCDVCQRAWHQAWDVAEGKIAEPPLQPSVSTPPKVGTFWTHRNGNVYEVLMSTNEASGRDEYQPQIVYKGSNGKVWSRPVSDWSRSFTEGGLRPLRECPDCGLGMADSHVCKPKVSTPLPQQPIELRDSICQEMFDCDYSALKDVNKKVLVGRRYKQIAALPQQEGPPLRPRRSHEQK